MKKEKTILISTFIGLAIFTLVACTSATASVPQSQAVPAVITAPPTAPVTHAAPAMVETQAVHNPAGQ